MILKNFKNNKFEYLIILLAIILSTFWASYNLKKFDRIFINFDGKYYNPLLHSDLKHTWGTADKFRKSLKDGSSFLNSIPDSQYAKFLLPSVIVGYYYYLIDKDIYEKKANDQIVIKEKNFKFGLLIFQILIFCISIFFFFERIKKNN